jgi:hypothetical protein
MPGARHHLPVFDDADKHSRQKKKTGRQKTDFNGDIHFKTPLDRFYAGADLSPSILNLKRFNKSNFFVINPSWQL